HLDRELDHWSGEMHRVQRGSLPALERLLEELRATKPQPCPTVTLVHGDAKPGNFAFVGDEVSAVFDWEMTTVGDPLTDIGWMELRVKRPIPLAIACTDARDFLVPREEVIDRRRGRVTGDAHRLHPKQLHPADVGERITDGRHL